MERRRRMDCLTDINDRKRTLRILISRVLLLLLLVFSLTGYAEERKELIKNVLASLKEQQIEKVSDVVSYMQMLSKKEGTPDAFHVVDISEIVNRLLLWQSALPQVNPFYAVKTNPDAVIVKAMAALGAGFDCASEHEMKQVLETGTPPTRIIFAQPRKFDSGIRFAKQHGIKKMTFDSVDELQKMAQLFPDSEFVLRIKTDDSHSSAPLSIKFGATLELSRQLIKLCAEKKLNLIGISFHVGSGATDPEAYRKSIADAAGLIQYARDHYKMDLRFLDIGGGWPGANVELFRQMARVVNEALQSAMSKGQISAKRPLSLNQDAILPRLLVLWQRRLSESTKSKDQLLRQQIKILNTPIT